MDHEETEDTEYDEIYSISDIAADIAVTKSIASPISLQYSLIIRSWSLSSRNLGTFYVSNQTQALNPMSYPYTFTRKRPKTSASNM